MVEFTTLSPRSGRAIATFWNFCFTLQYSGVFKRRRKMLYLFRR